MSVVCTTSISREFNVLNHGTMHWKILYSQLTIIRSASRVKASFDLRLTIKHLNGDLLIQLNGQPSISILPTRRYLQS